MPSSPSAVLLDVGGVFLLPSRSHIRSALAQVGHEVAEDSAIDRAHYVAARVFPMDLDRDEWMGPYWSEYLRIYASCLEVPEDRIPEAVEHLRNEYVTGWLWSQEIEGSREGLRRLADTGVDVGVVSNADGTIESQLLESGILQVGPGDGVEVLCLVDSGVVGVEKPDPRIFDFALEVLGVEREDVWYVGDTPGFDVTGAQRAGLTPILMDPFDVNGDLGVTTVTSLTELAEMIGKQA
ncbi:MAG: HAD family hydrolase [Acidimicrobiia bacterium]